MQFLDKIFLNLKDPNYSFVLGDKTLKLNGQGLTLKTQKQLTELVAEPLGSLVTNFQSELFGYGVTELLNHSDVIIEAVVLIANDSGLELTVDELLGLRGVGVGELFLIVVKALTHSKLITEEALDFLEQQLRHGVNRLKTITEHQEAIVNTTLSPQ